MKYSIFLLIFLFACNQKTPQEQASKDSTNAMKESMDDIDKSSVTFATDAAKGNYKEIALGEIALKNSGYDRIRDYAKRMTAAHTTANELLQTASTTSGVTLPAGPGEQDFLSGFTDKKGAAFDKAYIKEMVDEHEKTVTLLEKAADLKDSGLQHYATEMLPHVKAHLAEAMVLLEDVRKHYRPEDISSN